MSHQISWDFPTYVNPDRNKKWYFFATIIFLALLLFSILTANFLFALIVIIATVLMFIYHHKDEEKIEFKISIKGIDINDQHYDFSELKNFWLIYEPPAVKNLYIKTKSFTKPNLVIPLQNQDPNEVRKFLKEYLEEDLAKEGEETLQVLERILKL